MKRVSYNVAKKIKEVGYPQERPSSFYVSKEYKDFDIGKLHDALDCYVPIEYRVNAPTYLDVWLWLWRKGIKIDIISGPDALAILKEDSFCETDPEDAIIAAIDSALDYLSI